MKLTAKDTTQETFIYITDVKYLRAYLSLFCLLFDTFRVVIVQLNIHYFSL